MEKWFRQILQGEHSLFRLSLPFRVRLFNVLALVGGMISLINGISSYVNNQDSVILGLNLGIAVLSFVLLFYAYKSGRYQFCYVVTIIMIFLMMFPYLFFKSVFTNGCNLQQKRMAGKTSVTSDLVYRRSR